MVRKGAKRAKLLEISELSEITPERPVRLNTGKMFELNWQEKEGQAKK